MLESASVRYRIAVGPIAGRKTLRLQAPGAAGIETRVTKRLTATRDGFSLNASVACGAGERKKLERLCRTSAARRARKSSGANRNSVVPS